MVIVPMIVDLLKSRSVIDFSCGIGTFLFAFKQCGVRRILRIESGELNEGNLLNYKQEFLQADVEKPLELGEDFDLAIFLEIGEHLFKEKSENFDKAITYLAPIGIFSAAIPGQGGPNHIKEQWPEYWARKFEEAGSKTTDWIRKKIWYSEEVEY